MRHFHWLFVVMITLQIVISHQQLDGGGSARPGCVTAAQAQSISEEIVKLFATAPLVDSATNLFSSVTTLSLIEECSSSGRSGFSIDDFNTKKGQLLARASQAENKINEGNKYKKQQEDLADRLFEMWKKIKRTTQQHQKILVAFDIFVKDSALQKAASIEHDIKTGTSEQWTLEKIKTALKDEMARVKRMMSLMPPSITYSMTYVINEIIDYYTSSLIYTSLRNTSLYDDIRKDLGTDFRVGYSDVSIAKNIRSTANMKYGTMITGHDQAIDYVTKVNSTLGEIRQVVENLNKISEVTPCNERRKTGNDALQTVQNIYNNMNNNNVKSANAYLEAMEKYGSEQMMPFLTTRALGSGLTGLIRTLPDFGKRTVKQSEAYREVGGYAINVRIIESVPEAITFVERAFPFIDVITSCTRCYVKILGVIGSVVQGCIDGKGSFDDIYRQVTTEAKLNRRKCYQLTGLEIPSKRDIESIVGRAASEFEFNADCSTNKQRDDAGGSTSRIFFFHDSDEEDTNQLSPTQRKMVCDLRKKTNSQMSRIASLIKVDQQLVGDVRCKVRD